MPAGFEYIDQIVYGGAHPWWHGGAQDQGQGVSLGVDTFDAATLLARAPRLNFTVDKIGLRAADNGDALPNQYGMRCSDGYLIDTAVGADYEPYQISETIETLEAMGVRFHTAGTLLGRKKYWILGQLPGATEVRRREGDTDSYVPYILGSGSFDGSDNQSYRHTKVRVVCLNTYTAARQRGGVGVGAKHTRNMRDRLALVAEVLGLVSTQEAEQAVTLQALADAPMAPAAFVGFTAQLLTGLDDAQAAVEQIQSSEGRAAALFDRKRLALERLFYSGRGNRGNSALDALNAVTEYIDYGLNRADASRINWDTQGAATLFGTGAALKSRALALVTA